MGIPPEVDHLCKKALQRDPDRRWQTAAELGAAIEEIYAETVVEATGPRRLKVSRDLLGGALALDEGEASELRLRRSDLDAFERGLRRRQALVWSGAALLAAGGATALALYLTRPPPTTTAEREPNDEPAQADRIAARAPVTGFLGKRRSPTEGDRDVYVLKLPGGGRRVVAERPGHGHPEPRPEPGDRQRGRPTRPGSAMARRCTAEAVHGHGRDHGRADDAEGSEAAGRERERSVHAAGDGGSPGRRRGRAEQHGGGRDGTVAGRRGARLPGRARRRGSAAVDRVATGRSRWWCAPMACRSSGACGDGASHPGAARIELKRGDVIRVERRDTAQPGPPAGRDAPWSIVIRPS